ncbi:hypothetical protein YC2023_097933 [Brassica napus]
MMRKTEERFEERRGVRMSRAAASKGKKKGGVSFTIDCSKPVDDKIMEIASLISFRENFFHTEIEGWQLLIVSVLDVLDITLSQSSQISSR